ncbi:hypothetical protein niasHT_030425 [Heterodera trifolii]|uniref:Uncharacterized protein n=1 Tax=Heterodera trifolii TaxID=157864 RepID=A0ABD2IVM7_9BILA
MSGETNDQTQQHEPDRFYGSKTAVSALQFHSFPKVTTIQMSTEEGFRIYEHWTTQAFATVLSVFLQEMHPNKDQLGMVPDQFNECYFGAQTVPRMAKCMHRSAVEQRIPNWAQKCQNY